VEVMLKEDKRKV